ncbi:serine hydrolase [Streptomyces sp. SM12]|uniref:serine hydrolase domain-containing protein n=1 Tax=Streptomyces sp. SM12 TaxID=1071602 RepID=UPI000CD58A23|nr:serine hydrolase domain-containing protein [Streptomyces sp. SM12]
MHILFRRALPLLTTATLTLTPLTSTPLTSTPLTEPPGGPSAEPRATGQHGALDTFLHERLDATGVPGAAFAVVGPDGVEHSAVLGTDGDGRPVTERTPFLWGSVSKPVTGTLVLRLADAGHLELEDPVTDHLPWFELKEPGAERITVRHLLLHTSGLPAGLHLTDSGDPGRDATTVSRSLAEVTAEGEPGADHRYSSLNYLLLSAVVEQVTGAPADRALTQHVLGPLGMDTTVATAPDAAERLPPGHRYVLGRPVGFDTPYDPAGTGYGYLGGSLLDLAAYARAQLGGNAREDATVNPDGDHGAAGGAPLLDPAHRAQAHYAGITTGEERGYGLGWRRWPLADIGVRADGDVVWHGGAVPGYQTSLILLPEREQAVVLLQNAYGSFQETALLETAFGLAALLHGEQPVVSGGDGLYPVLLGAFALLALVLLVLLARTVAALARGTGAPDTSVRRTLVHLAAWVVPAAVVGAAALWWLPSAWGVPPSRVALWAPDVAWSLHGLALLCGALALARTGLALRSLRPRHRRKAGHGEEPGEGDGDGISAPDGR